MSTKLTYSLNNVLKRLSVIVVLCVGAILPSQVNATHIIGGNLYYTCLGDNFYEITLMIRRDCYEGAHDAPHDDPAILSIFDGNGQFFPRRGDNGHILMDLSRIDTLDLDIDRFCIDSPKEVCVSESIYKKIIQLPFDPSGYIISYQRCCRNGTLTNIELPLETGGTWVINLSPESMLRCNSSPSFKAWPPVYICMNEDLVVDHSATDLDGDSLVYRLCTPFSGATITDPKPAKASDPPYDSVQWKSPYNLANLMGGVPLKIDRSTGVITATPDKIGQFLVGVIVEEYRNGQLIGHTKRDFEFNVRACGDKPEVAFDVLTEPCGGLTIEFENKSTNANQYTWYFDHPNLQPSSNEFSPTHTYDSAGTYTVVLVAENDAGCIDSAVMVIEVLDPQLNPNFDIDIMCDDSLKLLLTNTSTSNYALTGFEWTVQYPGGTLTSSEENPMLLLTEGGLVKIKLKITDEYGCMAMKDTTVDVKDFDLEFIQDSFDICLGDEIKLLKKGNPDLTYSWSPTDGLKLDPPHDPKACPTISTTYCVTVTDGVCSKSGCVYVGVTDTIPVDIMGPDSTCNGQVNLMAVSDSLTMFEWSTDPSFNDIFFIGDKVDTIIDRTTSFYVRAGGDTKCPGMASHTVIFFDAVVENIDRNPIICFGPGMIELNPGGNPDYLYTWAPGRFLDDSTSHNPKAMLDSTTKFTVHIINPDHPDCPDTIMVNVRVGDTLEILGLPEDTILCSMDSVTFRVETVPADLKVRWCDQDGNEIGSGHEVSVNPIDLDFVVVKASDTLDCTIFDTMDITLYKLDIEIISDDTICAGDTAMIMLIDHGTDSLIIYWEPAGDIIGPNDGPVIKVAPDKTTIYTAFISNGKGCEWERDVVIEVGGFSIPIIVTADPMEINPGECTQLDVNIDGDVTYMWTGEGLDDPGIKSPKATILEPGMYTYTVKITDEMGCMITGSVTVKVRMPDCEDGVFLPNAFSPNNDGHNDILYVRSFFVQSMELIIFDRWGEVVFLSRNQATGWDGTFRGNTLSPDVYGYRLKYKCIDGEDYVKSGNVSLLK